MRQSGLEDASSVQSVGLEVLERLNSSISLYQGTSANLRTQLWDNIQERYGYV